MDVGAAMGTPGRRLFDVAHARGRVAMPTGPAPEVLSHGGGFRCAWSDPAVRGIVAVRALDAAGGWLSGGAPWLDLDGRWLWCREVVDQGFWVPDLGLPPRTVALEIEVWLQEGARFLPTWRCRVAVPEGRGRPWSAEAWAMPLVTLAVAVAHADGQVRRAEAEALLAFAEDVSLEGVDWTAALLRPTPAVLGPAVACVRLRWPDWGPRTLLLKLASVAGPAPGEAERRVLIEIGSWMGAPASAVEQLFGEAKHGHARPELRVALAALGLAAPCTLEQARAAWRSKVSASHPDRVARHGAAAVREATARVQGYNAAWAVIQVELEDGIVAPPRLAPAPPPEPVVEAPPERRRPSPWVMGVVALGLLALAGGLWWAGQVERAAAAGERAAAAAG